MPLLSELIADEKKRKEFAHKVAKMACEDHYVYPGEIGPTMEEILDRMKNTEFTSDDSRYLIECAEAVFGTDE